MSCTPPELQRVIFSLGSNVGDRLATLESACDYLADVFGGLRLSQLYETEPVGCPAGSPPYLNACVEVSTAMPPQEILQLCLRIEKELGRERNGIYGAPRTCDIDIVTYGDLQLCTPELTLPHPRAHEREFVLRPLCDLDPHLKLPGHPQTAAQLLAELSGGPEVKAFDL